jgi:cyclopropane-fatty-acyl-phospholipid synthase
MAGELVTAWHEDGNRRVGPTFKDDPSMLSQSIDARSVASPAPAPDGGELPRWLPPLLDAAVKRLGRGLAFEVVTPAGARHHFGAGAPRFSVRVVDARGVAALRSLDELRIGEAYLDGALDIEGDLCAALELRAGLSDRHPLHHLWSTYGQRLLFGQTRRDRAWIGEHYDESPDFYLSFLDERHRCYSHGYFAAPDEALEDAIERKLATALRSAGVGLGARVLDIGAGWGAFTEFAGRRGIEVTSLTISAESARFVGDLIAREGLPCRVLREHFLEHRASEPYDAIVNLGVTEHLPDYRASLAQYERLLRPGGRLFLDACASRIKFPFSAFVSTHLWPGNATPLVLADYLDALADTPFELLEVQNDRESYRLTTKAWAERLEARRDEIVRRFGARQYRRFRLYLWGCVHAFATDNVTAYHVLLQKPSEERSGARLRRGNHQLSARRLYARVAGMFAH